MGGRTLRLTREALTELTGEELAVVAGAAVDPSIGSCPVARCVDMITDVISGACFTYACPDGAR